MYWYLDQSLTRVFCKTKMKIFVFWLILYLMMFGLYWAQPQTLTSMKSLHSSDTARHRFKLAVSSLEGKWDRSSQEWSSIYLRKTLWRKKSRSQEKRLVIRSFIVKNKENCLVEVIVVIVVSFLLWLHLTGRGCNSDLCQVRWLDCVMQQWEEPGPAGDLSSHYPAW